MVKFRFASDMMPKKFFFRSLLIFQFYKILTHVLAMFVGVPDGKALIDLNLRLRPFMDLLNNIRRFLTGIA